MLSIGTCLACQRLPVCLCQVRRAASWLGWAMNAAMVQSDVQQNRIHRRRPLETLGVPVRWEADPGTTMKSALDHLKFRATDAVGAATIGLARKFIDPRDLPSVEQAEAYDDDYLADGWFDRMVEYNARVRRDPGLVCTLDAIYRDHAAEQMRVGVIWGAAHMPAVTAHLCGELGYKAASAEWLTVAHAKS
jgi:hypothetical protein